MKMRVKDISGTLQEILDGVDSFSIGIKQNDFILNAIVSLFPDFGIEGVVLGLSYYYTRVRSHNKLLTNAVIETYEGFVEQFKAQGGGDGAYVLAKATIWSQIFQLLFMNNYDKYTTLYPQIKGLYEHIADSVNVNRNINKSYMSTHDKTLTAQKVSSNSATDTGTTKEATNQVITTNDQSTNSYHGFNVPEQRPVNSDTATSTETTTGNADDNVITTNSTKQGNETVDDTETHKDDINGSDTITAWTVGSNKNKTLEALTSIQNLEQMKIINMICKDIDDIITLKIY